MFRSLLLLYLWTVAASPAAASTLSPPDVVFVEQGLIEAIEVELRHGHEREAAARLDALLAADTTKLVRTPAGMTSLSAWARQQLANRPGMAGEFARLTRDAATAAVAEVTQRHDHRPEHLYSITERFPRTPVEPAALLAAARRSVELGDPVAADDLLHLARELQSAPPPTDESLHRAVRASLGDARRIPTHLPFEAPWYATPDGYITPKFVPTYIGDSTFVAGPGGAIALGGNGNVVWKHSAGVPKEQWSLGVRGRGRVFRPAVVATADGTPQVVVVQQGQIDEDTIRLRALRARDGRLLWSTDARPDTRDLEMIGVPTVVGRFVYVVATSASPRGAVFELVALDVTDGSLRWRRELGVATDPPILKGQRGRQRDVSFDPQPFWQQSAPAVDGDLLLVAPSAGTVAAVDRFTGDLRWLSRYETAPPVPADQWHQHRDRRSRGENPPPPLRSQQLVRHTATPAVAAGVVVVGPLDAPNVTGFDRATGRILWTQLHESAPIVVGAHAGTVVLAGVSVVGIDARTGGQTWSYTPPAGATITGPPVVQADVVQAPVAGNVVTLSTETGQPRPSPTTLPQVRRLFALEPIRRALSDIGAGFPDLEPKRRDDRTPPRRRQER